MAEKFNKGSMVSMMRKPSQIKERWENYLKNSFKRFFYFIFSKIIIYVSGAWTLKEDLGILDYVMRNGTKWAKLARILKDRNEHQIKNRFFGLMAKFTLKPIIKIKREKQFLDQNLLLEAKKYFSEQRKEVLLILFFSFLIFFKDNGFLKFIHYIRQHKLLLF